MAEVLASPPLNEPFGIPSSPSAGGRRPAVATTHSAVSATHPAQLSGRRQTRKTGNPNSFMAKHDLEYLVNNTKLAGPKSLIYLRP